MKYNNRFAYFIFAVLLAALAGCASTPTSEGTGQYLDSSMITTKVKTALLNEPGLKSTQIHVTTFKGEVRLSGYVDTQTNMDKAVKIARGVKGVKAVKNDLKLKK
ncbi:MAG: BON domain-containing protein [Gammaproteobacteria bacterium]